jgi:glutamine---fructose-6-phosphate transaminase (isomerizing)
MSQRIPFLDAMAAQPEQLVHVLSSISASLDAADLPAWTDGSTLGVVAMGASRNSGHALVAALAQRGVRATNTPASEVLLGGAGFQPADYYLVVSESGRSPEPLDAATRLGGPKRVGITNFPHSQIAECVDAVVGLGEVPDSGVYTVGYTGTLLAYALLLERLGLVPPAELDHVPGLVGDALTRYADAAERAAALVAAADSIDVVGQGTSYAAAAELALMLREGIRKPAAAFETYEYLHGPMECLTPAAAVVLFGDGRETTIPDRLVAAGVPVVLITTAQSVPAEGSSGLEVIRIEPQADPLVRSVLEIVVAQLLLAAAARKSGLPIDEFVFDNLGTKLEAQPVAG